MSETRTDRWRRVEPPRSLNKWEQQILSKLLSAPFEGHEELRAQIGEARVYEESPSDPSVMLWVDPSTPGAKASDGGPRSGVVPFELFSRTAGDVPIWALLDTRDGRLYYLDVQRADGVPLQELPEPTNMQLHPL
jgi:hypothetical protein